MMQPNLGAAAVTQSYMAHEIDRIERMIEEGLSIDSQRLRNYWEAGKKRRSDGKLRQSMYDNDWKDQLLDELEKRFRLENFKKLMLVADYSLNLLRWVVRKVAGPYKKPARRLLDGEENERYEALMLEADMHLSILEATRLCQLHRDVLVGPYPQTRPDGTKRIRYRILTPDQCEVITRPGEPNEMMALIYSYTIPNTEGYDQTRYVYWDANTYREYNDQWQPIATPGNEAGVNPYGMIPFTAWHAELATRKFWHDEVAKGLIRANLNIGTALTDFWHALKHNSYKQIVVRSGDTEADLGMLLDPSQIMDLGIDKDADAQVLDMTIDFMKNIEAIWQVAGMILHMHGISPKVFRGQLDGQSGYALEIQERDLAEVHDEQRQLYPAYERDLYRVTVAVNNAHPEFEELPPDAELTVEYDDIGPGQSPTETAEHQKMLVESKFSTHVMAIQAIHDCDEERAQEIWEAILAEQKAISPMPMVPIMPMEEDDPEGGDDPSIDDPNNNPDPNPDLPRRGAPGEPGRPGDTTARFAAPAALVG